MAKNRKIKAPTGKVLSREAVVTNWLVELIEQDGLYESIARKDDVDEIVRSIEDPNIIPKFSIDYASRMASAKASKFVLEQLHHLEIVTVDKSISLKTGEILRPDIIAYNPDSRVIVVFEVKRDELPERQAVSELAGYEHELQNLFPFLSNMDICFVVVARNWTDLLSHGVAGLTTWSGKQCLALSLDYDAQPRELRCQIVEAWHLTGSVSIPQQALQCYDVALYESSDNSASDEIHQLPAILQTAVSMIARDGDRMRSHGFLVLWRDTSEFSDVSWVLTICVLDPGVFRVLSAGREISRASKLTKYFDEIDGAWEGSMPASGYRILDQSRKLLSEDYDVQIENHHNWSEKLRQHRHRSEPVLFEFWGQPGEFARSFITSSAVRNILLTFLPASKLDWSSPLVAIPVIGYMSGRIPFSEGKVICKDLLETGITLGSLQSTYSRLSKLTEEGDGKDDSEKNGECDFLLSLSQWMLPEAVLLMAELVQLHLSYESLAPPPPLTNELPRAIDSINKIIEWVGQDLIGENDPIHTNAFYLGLVLSGAYEATAMSRDLDEVPNGLIEERENALHFCQMVTTEMLGRMKDENLARREREVAGIYMGQLSIFLGERIEAPTLVRPYLGKLKFGDLLRVVRLAADAADSFMPPVLHSLRPTGSFCVDIGALKNGAMSIFMSGDTRPAVIVDSSGNYGTGYLPEEGKIFPPLESVENEVYFLDQRVAVTIIQRKTWEEVERHFYGDKKVS